MLKIRLLAAAALAASGVGLALSGPAQAAVSVFGSGYAEQCFHAARDGRGDIADCTRAINGEIMDSRDLAGTYVNRGVLFMSVNNYRDARRDFEASIKLYDKLGESYVNLGAVKIAQGAYADGIADIDRGLALGSEEPEKAYFNRGLADEYLGDIKTAYFDYSKAAELKPNWLPPRNELSRFSVHPAN